MVISKIAPSLKLRTKTDAELSDYAKARVLNLTVNKLRFPGLKPDAIMLGDIVNAYDTALQKAQAEPSKSATNDKNEKRTELINALQTCAQNCSEIAGDDVTLFLLSGFDMRAKPTPVNSLAVPEGLVFKQGPMDGSVYASFKSSKNAKSYEVWVGPNNNPSSWTKVKVKSSTPILITDLVSLSVYYGRCRAIGSRDVTSDWSQIIEFKVM